MNLKSEDILVVDDSHMVTDSLQSFLESEGFNVNCCTDETLALGMAKDKRYDIFLIDYRMPMMNGDDLVRRLRCIYPNALIIGYSIESKYQAFLNAGADAFVANEELVHKLIPTIKYGLQQKCSKNN